MDKTEISKQLQWLMQIAEEEELTRAIWALTPEQKGSVVFKEIGQQRYLSALRSGGIDNALMTRNVFHIDPYFIVSKFATDAARRGFLLKIERGQLDVAQKIKETFNLPDEIPAPYTDPLVKIEIDSSIDTGKVPPLPPQGDKV